MDGRRIEKMLASRVPKEREPRHGYCRLSCGSGCTRCRRDVCEKRWTSALGYLSPEEMMKQRCGHEAGTSPASVAITEACHLNQVSP